MFNDSVRPSIYTAGDEINGHRKYDSRVFLGGYLIERLKIA